MSSSTARRDLARRLAALRRCAGADCRRGAALLLAQRPRGACRVDVELRGADAGRIARVRFLTGRQEVSSVASKPYRATVLLTRKRPAQGPRSACRWTRSDQGPYSAFLQCVSRPCQ